MRSQSFMRRALLGLITIAAAALAAPAHAQGQDGPYRRFTRESMDTNQNEKEIYWPIGSKFTGHRPGTLTYGVAAAAWYQQALGSGGAKPDSVLDHGQYTLEHFDLIGSATAARPQVRVVITRRPGAASGVDLPQLEVVDAETQISAQRAYPTVERLPDGIRYTFVAAPPLWGVSSLRSGANRGGGRRYELRFIPESGVEVPKYVTRAPTFGGADLETRMMQGPPRLPVEERVAGKRIEYRTGKVIEDPKK